VVERGRLGLWLQQVAWGTSKDLDDTSSYDIAGWGAAGGAEFATQGLGRFGASLAFLNGRDEHGGNDNEVRADQYEIAGTWRGEWGGLRTHARASAAHISFEGTRTFTGTLGKEVVQRTAKGAWDGKLYSTAAGVSYEFQAGRLSLRPLAALDYYRLSEDGYTEAGGGTALNLTVDKRTSDELAAEASLTLGYDIDARTSDGGGWLRAEIEGGRRQIIGGDIGTTTARFGTGTAFTLLPKDRGDGWTGKLRVIGGSSDFSLGGEIGAEEQQGRAAVAGRISLQFGF
jgi:uncharacterized protein with beta-barrel porin domain